VTGVALAGLVVMHYLNAARRRRTLMPRRLLAQNGFSSVPAGYRDVLFHGRERPRWRAATWCCSCTRLATSHSISFAMVDSRDMLFAALPPDMPELSVQFAPRAANGTGTTLVSVAQFVYLNTGYRATPFLQSHFVFTIRPRLKAGRQPQTRSIVWLWRAPWMTSSRCSHLWRPGACPGVGDERPRDAGDGKDYRKAQDRARI